MVKANKQYLIKAPNHELKFIIIIIIIDKNCRLHIINFQVTRTDHSSTNISRIHYKRPQFWQHLQDELSQQSWIANKTAFASLFIFVENLNIHKFLESKKFSKCVKLQLFALCIKIKLQCQ